MALELVALLVLIAGIIALLASLLIQAHKKRDQLKEDLGDLSLEKERLNEKHQFLLGKYGEVQRELEEISLLYKSLEKRITILL